MDDLNKIYQIFYHKNYFYIFIVYYLINMDLQNLTQEKLEKVLLLCDILSVEDFTVGAEILATYNWDLERALSEMELKKLNQPFQDQAFLENPFYQYENHGANANKGEGLQKEEMHGFKINNNPYALDEGEEAEQYNYDEDEYEYSNNIPNQNENAINEISAKKQMFEEEYASLLPLNKTISQPSKLESNLEYHKVLSKSNVKHRLQYMKSLIKNSESACEQILQKLPNMREKYYQTRSKMENNYKFIKFLSQKYNSKINFTFGSFYSSLIRAYLDNNKPLLVYIHDIYASDQLLELILTQREIAKFVNQNCTVYGMFANSDDYQIVQKYFPLKNVPGFALFTFNKSQKCQQFVSSYKIVNNENQVFLQWLAENLGIGLKKRTKSSQAIEEQEENKMKNSKQIKQSKQKIEEGKKSPISKAAKHNHSITDIVLQQNRQFEEMQKLMKIKKQISYDRKEQLSHNEEELKMRKKMFDETFKEPEKNSPGVIEIRFRMPLTGETKTCHFQSKDSIQRLFSFVDCYCRDQFQEKFNEFDLTQTFPTISLRDRTNETIDQVFSDSTRENIIIKQF